MAGADIAEGATVTDVNSGESIARWAEVWKLQFLNR